MNVILSWIAIGLGAAGPSPTADEVKELQAPRVWMVRLEALARTRQRLKAGDASLRPAAERLRREAVAALRAGPFSVMDKPRTAASGDKHDYLSYAPYQWPDRTKKDGLPYVGRDGQVNPESVTDGDRLAMNRMAAAVQTLALGYSLLGDQRCAEHGARLLRTWFLDPHTRMNPHLKYAQAIPARCDGRAIGIIDSRVLIYVADSVRLLEGSAGWKEEDRRGMVAWCAACLTWLRESKFGRQEEAAANNHGTWYDAQVAALAIYAGQQDVARQVIQAARQRRLLAQVEADGRQPRELVRTRSFFYSLVNLRALFVLAALGQRVGVDLWHEQPGEASGLRRALDYVAPYADRARVWPHRELRYEREELIPFLLQAAGVYGDTRYLRLLEHFPADEVSASRGRLLYAP